MGYKGYPGGGKGAIGWSRQEDYSASEIKSATRGINGLGGGGGASCGHDSGRQYGNYGGAGTIRIKFYKN